MRSKKIPDRIFRLIKKNIPFSCVDTILIRDNEFFLVKRQIPPYKNKWCLPGGIIKKGQKIAERIVQVGIEELGIKFQVIKPLGVYEKIYKDRHDISYCFVVKSRDCNIVLNFQASEGKFFKKIPKNTALFHVKMLIDAGFK